MRILIALALLSACAAEVPVRPVARAPVHTALCCFEARFDGWAALACFAGDRACAWGLGRARTYGGLAGVKSLGTCRHLR